MDNPNADRLKRRTALVARELSRYSIDITVLSETRFADEGQLTGSGASYIFCWSGNRAKDRLVLALWSRPCLSRNSLVLHMAQP